MIALWCALVFVVSTRGCTLDLTGGIKSDPARISAINFLKHTNETVIRASGKASDLTLKICDYVQNGTTRIGDIKTDFAVTASVQSETQPWLHIHYATVGQCETDLTVVCCKEASTPQLSLLHNSSSSCRYELLLFSSGFCDVADQLKKPLPTTTPKPPVTKPAPAPVPVTNPAPATQQPTAPPVAIPNKSTKRWSAGSTILLLLFLSIAAYFVLGAFYRRFIVGARGLEQLPNHSFWLKIYRRSHHFCRSTFGSTPRHGYSLSADDHHRFVDDAPVVHPPPPTPHGRSQQDYQPVNVLVSGLDGDASEDERLLTG